MCIWRSWSAKWWLAHRMKRTTLSTACSIRPSKFHTIGLARATIVTGGMVPFTGICSGVMPWLCCVHPIVDQLFPWRRSLLYATSKGGTGTAPSYIFHWRYQAIGQAIAKVSTGWLCNARTVEGSSTYHCQRILVGSTSLSLVTGLLDSKVNVDI